MLTSVAQQRDVSIAKLHAASALDAGLHDLLGNVWEWTSTVYKPAGELRDRNKPKYISKGGSFLDQNISISSRFDSSFKSVGLLCV